MIFDAFAICNGLLGFVSMTVILPAFVKHQYRLIAAVFTLILVVYSIFLYSTQQMPVVQALLRSAAVASVNVLVAYLIAHFFHHKRSVLDLFRRTSAPE
ncbi:hypothetical protein [Pseudomonas sp. B22129]|uniref:hypothetical protein n=1 Tax=Pseudomonas sp. B22129 TaxID=3235111 RepID=UPI003782F665